MSLWTITARPDPVSAPEWTATFTEYTPAEIIRAFAGAATDDRAHGHDGFLQHRRPQAHAWAPLVDQGWRTEVSPHLVDVLAPDELAALTYRRLWTPMAEARTGIPAWLLHGGPYASPYGWSATFTSGTPAHLVAAATAATSDPTPLSRKAHELFPGHQRYLHTAPTFSYRAQAAMYRSVENSAPNVNGPALASPAMPGSPASSPRR